MTIPRRVLAALASLTALVLLAASPASAAASRTTQLDGQPGRLDHPRLQRLRLVRRLHLAVVQHR